MSASAVRDALARAAKAVRRTFDMRDAFVLCGVAAAVYGGNVIYPGAGWLLGGVGLFWLGTRGV